MVGRTITHYRILDKLGEGGMGVVYKAEDTRLRRTVAVKFLHPEAVESEEIKARFLHEAQAAASIDHPNVCTIHEIDEADGRTFLVMAYIDGPTLRQKIAERPLKLREALGIAIQIGQGLQAAHAKEIVHRDIKSANVMIARTTSGSGQVKVMDFGLAHLADRTRITKSGVTLGTPAYMSPEQAQRLEVDRRSDIWSLGVVIYEMLTGRLPFEGEREEAVLYAIMNEDPEPITAQRVGLPPEIDRVVAKAMAKSPEERYPHVDDMLVDLRALRKALESSARVTPVSAGISAARPAPRWRRALPWALGGLAVAAAVIAFWGPWRAGQLQQQPLMRFTTSLPQGQAIDLSEGYAMFGFNGSSVALSPDGTNLVYVARSGQKPQLYLQRLGEYEPEPIPGTEGGRAPFVSPDGNWVGFASSGALKKVSLLGGTPQTMCPLNIAFFGGSWGRDNTAFFSDCSTGLRRISAAGGDPETVTDVILSGEKVELQHQFPQVLPGGESLLFTIWNSEYDAKIAVVSLKTGEQRTVIEQGTYARYVPTGHLVYGWNGDLLAAPFDLDELAVTGPSAPVVEGVLMEPSRGAVHFGLSDNGTLVYVPGGMLSSELTLVSVDHQGNPEPLPFPSGVYSPRISPDGRQLLVVRLNPVNSSQDIWVYDLERGTQRRLTDEKGQEWWALWTRGGDRIAFCSTGRAGRYGVLFSKRVDGSGDEELLAQGEYHLVAYSLSPDGNLLAAAHGDHPETGKDIWMVPMKEGGEPYVFLRTRFDETQPAFSPDGHWLAYASNESGHWEVLVRPFPGPGGVIQVSTGGGREPLWSRDGRELYYRCYQEGGNRVMAVSFRQEGEKPIVGKPRELFQGDFAGRHPFGRKYELSPDGKRFVMFQTNDPPPPPTQYRVVVNWFDELRRLVPSS